MAKNAKNTAISMLTKKQLEYIEIKVGEGKTDAYIAKKISVSQSTISRWKNKREFKLGFEEYQAEYFRKLIPEAMRTVKELLRSKNDRVRLDAAKDILDRGSFEPITLTQIEDDNHVLHQQLLKQNMQEMSETQLRALVSLAEVNEDE
ncbi:phBC6A51 family helix-turn-helix protein [Staphylococcus simulans]|uniref:phBC6A51 family helix-turn-helix protein n=1 Tax=Staphylococcus simulans TaxID=1286 RepID=UPI000D1E2934|nr:DNA-binding protein [Staphylococcus simulans]PTJ89329.1 DNA-binding protein [Staphylococcus simulans]